MRFITLKKAVDPEYYNFYETEKLTVCLNLVRSDLYS